VHDREFRPPDIQNRMGLDGAEQLFEVTVEPNPATAYYPRLRRSRRGTIDVVAQAIRLARSSQTIECLFVCMAILRIKTAE